MTGRLLFNARLLIVLVFGAFITVSAVTGGIAAFEPQRDRIMHYEFLELTVESDGAPVLISIH